MLKGASKPSLWLRNVQLASYSSLIAALSLLSVQRDETLREHGWLHNFGPLAWATVVWQAAGGLVVAVAIKYADNILRGFAQAFAIIATAVGSYWLFSFDLTLPFLFGVVVVVGSSLMYGNRSLHSLQELCPCYDDDWEERSPMLPDDERI